MSEILKILIVEDNQADVDLIRETLPNTAAVSFQIESVSRLSEALARLKDEGIDLVLLDLGLPDRQGLETFQILREVAPNIPVIILTGNVDQDLAITAVREGAQDYLIKGQIGGSVLMRAVRYARERGRVEGKIKNIAREWQKTFDSITDSIFLVDSTGTINRCNKAAEQVWGKMKDGIIGRPCWSVVHDATGPIKECPISRMKETRSREQLILKVDNRWLRITVDPLLNEAGEIVGAVHVVGDITERKQTAEREVLAHAVLELLNHQYDTPDAVKNILQLIKKFTDIEAIGIRLKDGDDFPYYLTSGFREDFVIAERSLCSRDDAGNILCDNSENPVLACMCGNIIRGRINLELPFFTKGGSFWTNCTSDLLASTTEADRQTRTRNRCNGEGYESVALIPLRSGDEIIGLLQLNDHRRNRFTLEMIRFFEGLGSSIGIALYRKRDADDLKEALEKYQSLASYVDSMYLVDQNCTFLFMNEKHLKRFALSLKEVIGKKYSDFHSEAEVKLFAENVSAVCKTGESVTEEFRSERDRKYFLRTFSPMKGKGSEREVLEIAVISKDITHMKLTEAKIIETLESLRKSMRATIQVMVSAVEVRDPYTAGHQTRVADLTSAIATEIGLPHDKIEGLRMAGSIHDIGKLSIPAELLSKPTKLSELEFALIKEHACKGFEMLKDVESPWPLAEIVHQHHERMDGSGYPQGLKGDEILIESQILGLADEVEAMASHRPYRPGLGIAAALNEIENKRGILFDDAIVDACLRLFREKGYQLPNS